MKKVVILENEDTTWGIYEESGQAVEVDFESKEEAFEYALDLRYLPVIGFSIEFRPNHDFYPVFYLIEAGRKVGLIEEDLDYEATWKQGMAFYKEFYPSLFNTKGMASREAMDDFLSHKVQVKRFNERWE